MSEPLVLVDKDGAIGTITLNRPKSMNALSTQLGIDLGQALEDLESDPNIRVLILTGAGKAFCAGVDLKELGGENSMLKQEGGLMSSSRTNSIRRMSHFSGPTIAAVNGVAITGGFELALNCDIIIASTAARFADTHARVGVYPGGGASQILSRTIGLSRALELSLTGNYLTAEKAYEWGLVNRVVAPDELLSTSRALAEDMLTLDEGILPGYKKLIRDGFGMTFAQAVELEQETARAGGNRVDADEVERRRKGILERGRSQKQK